MTQMDKLTARGPDQQRVAEIAGKLTKARKAMLISLPADGSWGRVPSRAVAKRAWWSMTPGLIEHRHCPPSPNEEWALSDYGLAVRTHLESGR